MLDEHMLRGTCTCSVFHVAHVKANYPAVRTGSAGGPTGRGRRVAREQRLAAAAPP